MTKLEQLALDSADDYCDCKEGEYCEAGAFKDGFIAGFKAARESAADLLDNALKVACIEVDQQDRGVLEYQVKRIEQLGEEEVKG